MTSDNTPQHNLIAQENISLKEALTQVLYQNEMLLGWLNGAVIKVDREGLVLEANEIALQALKYQDVDLLGRQYHETFHHTLDDGSEYPWDFCPVFAAIEDGSSHHVTNDLFWRSDGTSISVDYIVCPVRNEANRISGATLIFRNLTEMKLQEAKRIHGMKLESIGELSAGIAHEINTPIQFVTSNISFLSDTFNDLIKIIQAYQGLMELLEEQSALTQKLKEVGRLEEEADIEYLLEEVPSAIDQTVKGLKDVSRLILGLKGFAHSSDNAEKTDADINQIIKNSLTVCKNTYKYVARLETDFSDIPTIKVNHGDIGQVVLNLVVNAAQAIEQVKGDSDKMGTIRVTSECDKEYVIIRVSDTGGGIPEAIIGRVFDPFFTTKEVGQGSGQGLAIARNIVHEKHGGEISIESKPGEGTTFIVKLPFAR